LLGRLEENHQQRRTLMLNYQQILSFVKLTFDRVELHRPAAKTIKAILEARSPRLTDIGRKLASKPETGKKYVQRFLSKVDPRSALERLFMPDIPFVIGDATDIPRPQAKRTPYVGRLKDGRRGFWLFVLSFPYKGRAIPFSFSLCSSKTIEDEAGSRSMEHRKLFRSVKHMIGQKVLVLDREFSYGSLLEALSLEGIKFVIRLRIGSKPPGIFGPSGERVPLSVPVGGDVCYLGVHYQGKVKVNLAGRWKEGLNEPLWVVTNIEPKEALKVYEKRMKIEELFRDLKSLLGLEKVMSRTLENLEKTLALVLLAYGLALIAGELLRGKVPDPDLRGLYSGPFLLLKGGCHLVEGLRREFESALSELFRACVGHHVPTLVPT